MDNCNSSSSGNVLKLLWIQKLDYFLLGRKDTALEKMCIGGMEQMTFLRSQPEWVLGAGILLSVPQQEQRLPVCFRGRTKRSRRKNESYNTSQFQSQTFQLALLFSSSAWSTFINTVDGLWLASSASLEVLSQRASVGRGSYQREPLFPMY